MPFGKFKGTPIAKIEQGYLEFVLDRCKKMRPETRTKIIEELNDRQFIKEFFETLARLGKEKSIKFKI